MARSGVGHGPGPHPGDVAAGLGLGESEARTAARRVAIPGRYRCFWSSLPAMRIGPDGSRVSSSISAAVFEYLATSSMAMVRPRMPAPGPAELGGQAQAEQVGVAEGVEDVLGVLPGRVDLPGPGLDPVLGQATDGLLEGGELGREVEVHGGRGYPSRSAARIGGPDRQTAFPRSQPVAPVWSPP